MLCGMETLSMKIVSSVPSVENLSIMNFNRKTDLFTVRNTLMKFTLNTSTNSLQQKKKKEEKKESPRYKKKENLFSKSSIPLSFSTVFYLFSSSVSSSFESCHVFICKECTNANQRMIFYFRGVEFTV